jgi:hypothetical protein
MTSPQKRWPWVSLCASALLIVGWESSPVANSDEADQIDQETGCIAKDLRDMATYFGCLSQARDKERKALDSAVAQLD